METSIVRFENLIRRIRNGQENRLMIIADDRRRKTFVDICVEFFPLA